VVQEIDKSKISIFIKIGGKSNVCKHYNYLVQIRIPEVFHVVIDERVELKFHVYAQSVHVLAGHGHVFQQRLSYDRMSFSIAARELEKLRDA